MGAIGVTGTQRRQRARREADLVLAVGTRLQDFTTGSWALFGDPARRIVSLNVQPFDAGKHHAQPLVCDARAGLEALSEALGGLSCARATGALLGEREQARWIANAANGQRPRPTSRCRPTRR